MTELLEVDASDPEGIIEGINPYFPDDRGKTNYLSYRSCGFGEREAAKLAGVSQRSVQRWRAYDPRFRQIDTEGLSELRAKVSVNYLQMEFTRNFRMLLDIDRAVIMKKITGSKPLTKEDNDYLGKIRPMYTPQQLAALEGTILPEEFHASGNLNINVTVNGQSVDNEAARQAAARQLLRQFVTNNNVIEGEVISRG